VRSDQQWRKRLATECHALRIDPWIGWLSFGKEGIWLPALDEAMNYGLGYRISPRCGKLVDKLPWAASNAARSKIRTAGSDVAVPSAASRNVPW
jgi:hypothetical protein